ncbi:Shedu anti-phage system protein SduA domain-containing protein [Chloroflexota bacterium]
MKNKGVKHKAKPYKMNIQPGRSLEMVETEEFPLNITEEQRLIGKAVGPTMRAYVNAAKKLLDGKHSSLRDYAPLHLRHPSLVIAFCCKDGIIIRYESNPDQEKTKVGVGYSDESLSELAPKISEKVVYCRMNRTVEPDIPQNSPEIIIYSTSGDTGIQKDIVRMKVSFNSVIEQPSGELPSPPAKPYCILSVRNAIEIGLEIETIPDKNSPVGKGRFITRTPLCLPVGWDCIEIFPFTDVSYWKPEYAHVWADNDILATVVAHHQRERMYDTLDPNATARRRFSNLLQEYNRLLDTEPEKEEILQKYLTSHPELLCPASTAIWPKLAIGANVTDFVFKEVLGNYLLVELEKSTDPLFLIKGDRSKELKHAQDQISEWKRYIADNLSTVRTELGLTDISSNPRSLIVIGRSKHLSASNRRILQTMETDSPKNKIITYDELYENTKAIIENLFGPLWAEAGDTRVYALPE